MFLEKKTNYILKKVKEKVKILKNLSENSLAEKIWKIKKKYTFVSNEERLEILTEWVALIHEIVYRTLQLHYFDTQLVAGILLMKNTIVEMKMGEGKTLVSILPVSFNALNQKGSHVVAPNEYLAERDEKYMKGFYSKIGLSTGLVKNGDPRNFKIQSYNANITYLTSSEIVFNYLNDCLSFFQDTIIQRPLNYCLIDEIDAILIDLAEIPLIISTSLKSKNFFPYIKANSWINAFQKNSHFEIDEKQKNISLTEYGYQKFTNLINEKYFYNPRKPWIRYFLNALLVNHLYILNKDYIIENNDINLVNQLTGRLMPRDRLSFGVHEAICIKENLNCQTSFQTQAQLSIIYQDFFSFYPNFAGMTGTINSLEIQFQKFYNLKVCILPTKKPIKRLDFSEKVFPNKKIKCIALLERSLTLSKKGQPLLINTTSIEESEFFSKFFFSKQIFSTLLNTKPKNFQNETKIVAYAGKQAALTIATSMAGRGTNIDYGGDFHFETCQYLTYHIHQLFLLNLFYDLKKILFLLVKKNRQIQLYCFQKSFILNIKQFSFLFFQYKFTFELLRKKIQNNFSIYDSLLQQYYSFLQNIFYFSYQFQKNSIKNLGGLSILGTEYNTNLRIIDQLKGRSGRQGNPGSSQFFVSLNDEFFFQSKFSNFQIFLQSFFKPKYILKKIQTTAKDFLYTTHENIAISNIDLNFLFQTFLSRKKFFKNFFSSFFYTKEITLSFLFSSISNTFLPRFNLIRYRKLIHYFFQKNLKRNNFFFFTKRSSVFFFSYLYLIHNFLGFVFQHSYNLYFFENYWSFFENFLKLNSKKSFLSSHYTCKKKTSIIFFKFFDLYWTHFLEEINQFKAIYIFKAYTQKDILYELNKFLFNFFSTFFL